MLQTSGTGVVMANHRAAAGQEAGALELNIGVRSRARKLIQQEGRGCGICLWATYQHPAELFEEANPSSRAPPGFHIIQQCVEVIPSQVLACGSFHNSNMPREHSLVLIVREPFHDENPASTWRRAQFCGNATPSQGSEEIPVSVNPSTGPQALA